MIGMFRANKPSGFSLALFLLLCLKPIAVCTQTGPPTSDPTPNPTFQQLSAQATSAREAGRPDDAIRFYQSALKLQPDWAEGLWYLGTLNYDADHYSEAIPVLQKLISLLPRMGPALAFLGLSEFETKDYKNSLLHLQQAHRQGYDDDTELAKVATYHLAVLFNWSGEFDKTVELLTPIIKESRPPDEIKVALGMALLQIPLLPSDIDPEKDALIHAAGDAAVLLDAGNSAAALDALRQMLLEYPKTPYLHYACATALAAAGKNEEALQALTDETKISPRSALPYLRIAALNLQHHHAKQALPSARQAVLLAPRSAATHELLAQTLKSLGQIPEATKETALAKKLKSSTADVDSAQRQLYARTRAGEKTASPNAAAGASGQQTDDTANSADTFEALAQKAQASQAAGQTDLTISYFQRALALHPEWGDGWRNLGTLYYTSARYADAVAALKNSVAIDAQQGNTWALLGLSEFQTKDYKNSLIHLQRGHDLGFAGNAAAVQFAKYHLAVLFNRNGDFDRATELLTPEVGSGPPDEQTTFALGLALLRIPSLPDEVDPSRNSLIRLAGATAALLSGSKYDEAFVKFQQLLQMAPNTPYLHYVYGSALASISQFDKAEEQLVEETKITPGSALPFLRRSTIALQLKHPEDAARLAQRAVQLDPESAEAHYLLGRSWLDLGKTADSLKELETARGLAPNSPEVRFNLARAYAKAGQPDAAQQERDTFERLNAMVQNQRSRTGSQAYGAAKSQSGIRAAESPSQPQSASHP